MRMAGKRGLVFGVANARSIAWGCARAMHAEGARVALSYEGERNRKIVERKLAPEIGAPLTAPCDATDDASVKRCVDAAAEAMGGLDFVVHSMAYADGKELQAGVAGTSRQGFLDAMSVTAYSLIAVAAAARPHMSQGGALTTVTYLGGDRVCVGYNLLGVAKAALQAEVRYLAHELGPEGIRVNAISSGPVRTLSSMTLPSFKEMFARRAEDSPLRANTTIEDVGAAAVYLSGEGAANVTGTILFVDGGYNIMGTFER